MNRVISLNPRADDMEVVRITYPGANSRRTDWRMEPCRFIPHDGMARRVPA